jgi:hypothetical protein
MQKVLLSVILALVMALALVGMKRAFAPAGTTQGAVLVAEGTAPTAPVTGF